MRLIGLICVFNQHLSPSWRSDHFFSRTVWFSKGNFFFLAFDILRHGLTLLRLALNSCYVVKGDSLSLQITLLLASTPASGAFRL